MNAVNSWGATPLHEGIDRGDTEVITELLRGGPDLGIRATRGKHNGKNPLEMFHAKPQLACLLNNNNSPNSGNDKLFSLLHLFANCQCAVVELV